MGISGRKAGSFPVASRCLPARFRPMETDWKPIGNQGRKLETKLAHWKRTGNAASRFRAHLPRRADGNGGRQRHSLPCLLSAGGRYFRPSMRMVPALCSFFAHLETVPLGTSSNSAHSLHSSTPDKMRAAGASDPGSSPGPATLRGTLMDSGFQGGVHFPRAVMCRLVLAGAPFQERTQTGCGGFPANGYFVTWKSSRSRPYSS